MRYDMNRFGDAPRKRKAPRTAEKQVRGACVPRDPRFRRLGRKGASAAAAAACVRVLEREAGAHHRGDIIDLDAIEVLTAERIHEQLDAVGLQDLIVILRLVFNVQSVLKTGATAGQNCDAKACAIRGTLVGNELLHLSDRSGGDRDVHLWLLVKVFCSLKLPENTAKIKAWCGFSPRQALPPRAHPPPRRSRSAHGPPPPGRNRFSPIPRVHPASAPARHRASGPQYRQKPPGRSRGSARPPDTSPTAASCNCRARGNQDDAGRRAPY